jgi:AraC-like DNA-binding protein
MAALNTATLPRRITQPTARVHTNTVEALRTGSRTPVDPQAVAVHKALTFMRDHLSETQGLTDHARAASLSPYHFHRVFKSLTGVTPGRFLTSLRLAEAKRLLLCSSMSAAYIGRFVGYLSPGTFTTQFTRLVGLPPRRFREAGRALGGVPVNDALARRLQHHPQVPGSTAVRVCPRPDGGTGCVALAAFWTAVPQDRPTTCAAVRAGHMIALAGLDGARFIHALSLPVRRQRGPPSGTEIPRDRSGVPPAHSLRPAAADCGAAAVAVMMIERRSTGAPGARATTTLRGHRTKAGRP